MTVKRIVTNIYSAEPARARAFYEDVLGLTLAMDKGWIVTFVSDAPERSAPQLSVASEGGSGTELPDVSIEVDDVDAVLARAVAGGFDILYGPVDEPWGVRRFFVRDPHGKVLNILSHSA